MNLNVAHKNITGLMASSGTVLILISRPVDPDCIGTSLALQWLLGEQGKLAFVVSFFSIPETLAGFPDIEQVHVAQPDTFDFSTFDLIITVDGSSWGQFLGDEWKQVLGRMKTARIVNIDHHEAEEIMKAIPDRCFSVKTSSTAQVLFEYFIVPAKLTPPAHIADCLYRALLYDTRGFKNELHRGTYRFADALIAMGANHAAATDVNYDMREVRYLTWAVEHTEFIADLGVMLLTIDAGRAQELEEMFGRDFSDFDTIYKETIQRQVTGFNYGIILTDKRDGTVRLNWRTRGFANTLGIADIARRAGFTAGGHRNAGGGRLKGNIVEAKTRLLTELRNALDNQAAQKEGIKIALDL